MLTWSDKMGSRSRSAWLLLIKNGTVNVFQGETIRGICAIIGTDYKKQGKWSHTTYRLELAPGVRAVPGMDGWETGRFVEGLRDAVNYRQPIDRWAEVANALGVTLTEARRFLKEWRPKAAAKLDEVEDALASIDEHTGGDFETIAISFGGPNRRQREAGFWSWPVLVLLDNQEIGRLVPEGSFYVPSGQVKLIAMETSSGFGGGYVSMRLAVPAGAVAVHKEEEIL
jgi:hypothetical protein